jgi:hypothetical protein
MNSPTPPYWILDANAEPMPCYDALTWARWFENIENRRVAATEVGPYSVSTVFIGIDHRFGDPGAPLLWETMIFGGAVALGDGGEHQERYASRAEALAGHERAVAKAREWAQSQWSKGDSMGSGIKIVVLDRGWVLVGEYGRDGDRCVMTKASIVRRWGTSQGLGELAQRGPLPQTVLDPCGGAVEFDARAQVLTLACSGEWEGKLS